MNPRAAVVGLVLAACQPSGSSRRAPLVDQEPLVDMAGSWRWLHRAEEPGTVRIEDERWRLRPVPGPGLSGHYLRSVEVRTTDARGFPCNQQLWYRQRALFDVVIEPDGAGGFIARETGYVTEPSPCDHGFRHVSTYTVVPRGNRLELQWDGGTQTLWQIPSHGDAESPADIAAPWPPQVPTGAWHWQTRSYDDSYHLREEAEWWELSRRDDTRIDATYRRRVTVRSVDGSPIACAGAPSYTFDDAYVLEGVREEEHWHFIERGVAAASHPCLAPTPTRILDEATAEQLGDFLVLEWRGKRRQVLHRPAYD